MELIQTKNLKKSYVTGEVETPVLFGVDLRIDKGEFVAIMGPSGSGKSTLMHILSFLDVLSSGEYLFEGKDASMLSSDELADLRNRKIGFIFQAFNLLPRTSVYDNVALPLLYSKKPKGQKEIMTAIEAVGLGHRTQSLSNQLSGGEKQRVAIARAIVNDPEVIFADEPTGNLDSKNGTEVMAILQHLNDTGHTIIMVTHEQDTASHAKRIVRLKDGLVVGDEPVLRRRLASDGELVK